MHNDDLEEKFIAFQRAAVQTIVLMGQLLAVLGAALCSEWWHYLVLAFVALLVSPLWGNTFLGQLAHWWKEQGPSENDRPYVAILEQEDMMLDAGDITETLDEMDRSMPPPPQSNRWPFDMGKKS